MNQMTEASKKRMEEISLDEMELLKMSTDHSGEHQYAADYRIGFRYGFNRGKKAGYESGMQDPEVNKELLDECEKVLLIAWGQLEAGCKEAERVDQMIEKIREARK